MLRYRELLQVTKNKNDLCDLEKRKMDTNLAARQSQFPLVLSLHLYNAKSHHSSNFVSSENLKKLNL